MILYTTEISQITETVLLNILNYSFQSRASKMKLVIIFDLTIDNKQMSMVNRDIFDSFLTRVKVWMKAMIIFDLAFSMRSVEQRILYLNL